MTGRIRRLAKALGMNPGPRLRIERDSADGRWWILGCRDGDQPLPRTGRDTPTARDALNAAEVWLAPELKEGE